MGAPTLKEAHESIYDVLALIRQRPPTYLDERSISRLRSFLVGYQCGLGSHGLTFRTERPDFNGFHSWVARRLGFSSSTAGWCYMILEKSKGEADALDRFFLLLDDFRKESL